MRLACLVFVTAVVLGVCRGHGHDGHGHDHHHHHEDEDSMIKAGKEKWFKKPDDTVQDQDHHAHDHAHGHDHHDHAHDHNHDHHHHDHGHGHEHAHDHNHDHAHGHEHHHHDHVHAHDHHDHAHGHDHHHHHGHDHGHGHAHGHSHDHGHGGCPHAHQNEKKTQPKKARTTTETVDMWWQAIFATLLISAAPFFILFFVPLESNAEQYQPLLKVLLSFASGGLLGDAFLHLIPHAIHPHSHGDHDHDHSHHDHSHGHDHSATTIVGLWVLAGIMSFLAVEKFVRHAKGGDHHHHHSHGGDVKEVEKVDSQAEDTASESEQAEMEKNADEGSAEGEKASVRRRKKGSQSDPAESQDEGEKEEEDKKDDSHPEEGMKVAGFLNLAADFTHNFTDGLAIGASFLGGQTLGIITTMTILLHEVPHEIGDFAILVQSGCNKNKAMFLQLSTATGALAGCILGLLAENIGEAATLWILPFTAGGFIYIATVSVIPELLVDAKPKQSIKEILAMLVGIAMMVLIGFLE